MDYIILVYTSPINSFKLFFSHGLAESGTGHQTLNIELLSGVFYILSAPHFPMADATQDE